MSLDDASLLYLFSRLPGETLAACAQVCRAWHAVAASEVLWQRKCLELEPHPHLRRDDLLPAFDGSHRAYYAWRWPLLSRTVGRLLVEGDAPGQEIATYPVPNSLTSDSGGGGDGGGVGSSSSGGAERATEQAGPKQGVGAQGGAAAAPTAPGAAVVGVEGDAMVQQATWSPAGSLLAFTEMRTDQGPLLESSVVVTDGRTGRRLGSWVLASHMPPFYFMWSTCGTRLLFLSNWEGGVVALRSLDIAPALLPPAARAALGATREVLLCTARPLFLSVSPASTRLLWHGGCRRFGLADAATHTPEDGAEDDCFFENAQLCPSQAPQWLVDAAGADWLLMPIMRPQSAGPGPAGALALAPLAAVSEALEAEGSRLSPSLLLSLSRQVADFASPRDLCFAATPDASHVAFCDRGALHVWTAQTGVCLQLFPLPAQHLLGQAPPSSTGGGGSGGGGDLWHTGAVQAMQWSPDGRRLLFLVRRSGSSMPMVALAKRPHYRWMVYDAADGEQPLSVDGWMGGVTQCLPFNPTLEFLDRYLLFFDQYSRSMRLWSPDSQAFCFCSRGQPAVGEVSEETFVHVQPVPLVAPAAASSASGSRDMGTPLLLAEAPLPVRVAQGTFAAWSWQ